MFDHILAKIKYNKPTAFQTLMIRNLHKHAP